MNILLQKAKRCRQLIQKYGWSVTKPYLKKIAHDFAEHQKYQSYIKIFTKLTAADREQISLNIKNFSRRPLISIVMPVYNVEEKWLRLCIESVTKQIYTDWEFCIADDFSTATPVRQILEEYASLDARFKIVFRQTNGHISAASNSALALATGEFTILLDHDDELHETALYQVAAELNAYPKTDMIYSDEDVVDENGKHFQPKFKPDWSPDFFYSLNLITHLSAYRTEILRKIGGFRLGFEGSQDYDLALRVTEEISAENVRHIPRILYHWRAIKGSVAFNPEEKPYAHERARLAIGEHFKRKNICAKAEKGYLHLHRAVYKIPDETFVSIILAGDNFLAIEKILSNTGKQKIEIMAVGKSAEKDARIKFVEQESTIAASFNRAAREAKGEVLIFLEADIAPIDGGWLRELASLALQKEIGVAGGKIFNKNATVRNAGIVLGTRGAIGFAHKDLPAEVSGNFLRAMLVNNFSAVSGAFAVRREIFSKGFDTENFANGFYEIDFCLRLRKRGLRNVFTPYAEFVQRIESPTEKSLRENSAEVLRFQEKWKDVLKCDPYYNPNLSLEDENFSIAVSPRIGKI